jgi:hypothetical protein
MEKDKDYKAIFKSLFRKHDEQKPSHSDSNG